MHSGVLVPSPDRNQPAYTGRVRRGDVTSNMTSNSSSSPPEQDRELRPEEMDGEFVTDILLYDLLQDEFM